MCYFHHYDEFHRSAFFRVIRIIALDCNTGFSTGVWTMGGGEKFKIVAPFGGDSITGGIRGGHL